MAGVLYILFTMFCHFSFWYITTRQKNNNKTTPWQLTIQTGFNVFSEFNTTKCYFVIVDFLRCLLIIYGDAREENVMWNVKNIKLHISYLNMSLVAPPNHVWWETPERTHWWDEMKIAAGSFSRLLSNSDTPCWLSFTDAPRPLLSCPLGGTLTPGPRAQVAPCWLTVVLFSGHITLMCLRCFLSAGFLAAFPALQTEFIKSFLISWTLDPTSCLWCQLPCEFLHTMADCWGTFCNTTWEAG